jgi:hypothetical protein
MIERKGREWVLKTKDGKKVLGTHPSKESAMTQERAIQINKSQKGKNDEQSRKNGR